MSDYWEKQDAMKEQLGKVKLNGTREEAYVKLLENSAISFKQMWEEEVAERKKIQRKYDSLTRQIKKQAVDKILEREVEAEINVPLTEKFMTLLRQGTSVSYPVCCSLEGIRSIKLTLDGEGEFGKLVQERLDDGEEPVRVEWDDDRMDVIGQNGNDGLHYDEVPGIPEMYEAMEKEVEDLKNKLEKSQNLAHYYKRLADFNDDEGL